MSNIVSRHDPPVKHFILGQHSQLNTTNHPTAVQYCVDGTLLYIPEIKILNIRYLFYIVSRLIRLDRGQLTVTHSGYTEQIGCPEFYL